MKFTNEFITMELIPVYNTGKATLFKFDTTLDSYGDITVDLWIPNFGFEKTKDWLNQTILATGQKGAMEMKVQIIQDFKYSISNKELDLKMENLDIFELEKLVNGKEIKESYLD